MSEDALAFEKASTCFLAMDFQADIVRPGGILAPSDDAGLAAIQNAIDTTARALDAARAAGLRIIHVTVCIAEDHPGINAHAPLYRFLQNSGAIREGSKGVAIVPEVAPVDGETVVVKRGISALSGTDLPAMLQSLGITTLVLTGIVTHWVIEGTARDAADRGYRLIIPRDCCASGTPERHEGALVNLASLAEIVTADEFITAL